MKFNTGKLYQINEYFWMVYPTKDIAAAAAAAVPLPPGLYAACAYAYGAADAAYWSNRFKCIVSYISENSIFCCLEQDEKFLKILSTNGEMGWIIYSEEKEFTKGSIEEVKQ